MNEKFTNEFSPENNKNLDTNGREWSDALDTSLRAAHPAAEPSDALNQRIAWMAQEADANVQQRMAGPSHSRPMRAFRLRPLRATMAVVGIVVALSGTLAYRYFMSRPGETAIQLMPADALLVVTLDTTPSPAQIPLFKRIHDALQREHLDTALDDAAKSLMDETNLSREIRPYLTHSFAFALLGATPRTPMDKAEPVLFLAVKDTAAAEKALQKFGRRERQDGAIVYRFSKQEYSGMLVANYLVFSPDVRLLARVQHVYADRLPTVAALPEYQEARKELPEDANLMCFVSPTALSMADEAGQKVGVNAFHDTRWMAMSGTLRDKGIVFDYRCPMDTLQDRRLALAGQVPAIEATAYKQLPVGAYTVFAVSKPAAYLKSMEGLMIEDGKAQREYDKSLAQFEKQTGISIPNDVLPALQGRTWMAVYPDAAKPDGFADGLMVIDDANGANPAALADKVRDWIERESAKGGTSAGRHPLRFTSTRQGNATTWHLDRQAEAELLDGVLGSALSMASGEGQNEDSEEGNEDGQEETPSGRHQAPGAQDSMKEYTEGKALVYAQAGKSLLVASSQAMLDKALAAYYGQAPTLAEDPAFLAMRDRVVPGAQVVFMMNLTSILERMQSSLKETFPNSHMDQDDLIHLFGGSDNGLVMSGRYDGQTQRGAMFLPLDYERLVRIIGGVRESQDAHVPPVSAYTPVR